MKEVSKKAKLVVKNPNPIYISWLEEKLKEAEALNDESRTRTLTAALESLRKFPIRLSKAKDCSILSNFPSRLITYLEKRELELALRGNADSHSQQVSVNTEQVNDERILDNHHVESNPKLDRALEDGCSWLKYRSPSYGVMLGMCNRKFHGNRQDYLSIEKICSLARPHTDDALDTTLVTSILPLLLDAGLILASGDFPTCRYTLSNSGREMVNLLEAKDEQGLSQDQQLIVALEQQKTAVELLAPSKISLKSRQKKAANSSKAVSNPVQISDVPAAQLSHKPKEDGQNVKPRSYSVTLLIDTAERGLSSTGNEFQGTGIDCEVRHLKVGDYAWIVLDEDGRELVLPFIAERKRLDDLIHSVRDGRFSEQKFRLRRSGVPNIIYIIENYSTKADTRCVPQAISNMLVKNSFTVKETSNSAETIQYLATLTHILRSSMREKILVRGTGFGVLLNMKNSCMELPEFNCFFRCLGKNRTYTAREMFVKQLVQLHGLSADKAWAITSTYKTPKALIEAFQHTGPSLVSELQYGLTNRKIGLSLSTILYQFYTSSGFNVTI